MTGSAITLPPFAVKSRVTPSLKLAVTVLLLSRASVIFGSPSSASPLQPVKKDPGAATASRVTSVPLANTFFSASTFTNPLPLTSGVNETSSSSNAKNSAFNEGVGSVISSFAGLVVKPEATPPHLKK